MFHWPRLRNLSRPNRQPLKAAYLRIVQGLEEKGYVPYPFCEKVEENLFAMRIKTGNNVRVFYVYADREYIYGVYAYEKKSQKIPLREVEPCPADHKRSTWRKIR